MHLSIMRPVQIQEILPINFPGRLGGVNHPKALEDQKKPGEDPIVKDPGIADPEVAARVPAVAAVVPEAGNPVPVARVAGQEAVDPTLVARVADPEAEAQIPAVKAVVQEAENPVPVERAVGPEEVKNKIGIGICRNEATGRNM